MGLWDEMEVSSGKRLQKTMENQHVYIMGKFTLSMTIFNSYVKLSKGIQNEIMWNNGITGITLWNNHGMIWD